MNELSRIKWLEGYKNKTVEELISIELENQKLQEESELKQKKEKDKKLQEIIDQKYWAINHNGLSFSFCKIMNNSLVAENYSIYLDNGHFRIIHEKENSRQPLNKLWFFNEGYRGIFDIKPIDESVFNSKKDLFIKYQEQMNKMIREVFPK